MQDLYKYFCMSCIIPTMNDQAIQQLEAVAFRMWPALKVRVYDGWLLRYARGHSKRTNSINPFGPSTMDVHSKISYCENLYLNEYQLDVHFRLTGAMQPTDLETHLAARGYQRWDETLVQTADLSTLPIHGDAGFHYQTRANETWLQSYAAMNRVTADKMALLREILERIDLPCCFGMLDEAAVGLAVCDGTYVGLFDIVVAPQRRKRGLGRALVGSLLAWARAQGAQTALLQVVATNQAAIKLYTQLGFRSHHRYWYRTRFRRE